MRKPLTYIGWIVAGGLLVLGDRPLQAQLVAPVAIAQEETAISIYNQAVALIQAGNYEQALEKLDDALELDSEYVDAYIHRGFMRAVLGDADAALADLNQALTRSPTPEVYKARAALRTRLGDHAGAVQDYDRALEQDSEDAEAYRGRAEAYRMISAYPAAEYNYTQALAFNPTDGLVYRRRGELRMGTGNLEGALEDFTEAIALRPDDPEAYYGRAIARSQLGDSEGAREDFQFAGELFLQRSQPERYRQVLRELNRLPDESR